ncbi:MAG: ACP phosphodiesterase [Saprospiraceae bacterium]|nr:ACP phosphodiesterase [Saprospiraceae bacterium]
MNHVAHCLLSFNDPDVLVGNFMGDFVKGRQWEAFPPVVQRGILLHRHIDAFTDAHAVSLAHARLLRPWAGRYAGAVLDILNDHLLYRNWSLYSTHSFEDFAERVFADLDARRHLMPPTLQERWPRMLEGRFLYAYTTPENLNRVLKGFVGRLSIPADAAELGRYFFENMQVFEDGFNRFFPALEASARAHFEAPS